MKKTLLTLALVGACAAAFAQGKVKMQNDGGSAIMLINSSNGVYAADLGLVGQAIPTTSPLPSGRILDVGLYEGTSASSLALVVNLAVSGTTNPVSLNPVSGGSGVPGVFNPQSLQVAGLAGGAIGTFQIRVWDSAYSSYNAEVAAGVPDYLGEGAIFTMTAGASITYPSDINGGGSTWTEAPIIVSVPEPSTFALAGLGAAAVLIFRRRK